MQTLENWSIVGFTLQGEIFGHKYFEDGENIHTSNVIGKKNGDVVTRSGSVYKLGSPLKAYEQLFPNAKERLLNPLKEISE